MWLCEEMADSDDRFRLLCAPLFWSPDVRRDLGAAPSSREHYRWIVGTDESGALGGVGAVDIRGEVAHMRHLYVLPHARGKGLGPMLVTARVALARAMGCKQSTATVSPLCVSIYASAGFSESGRRCRYTIMRRDL